MGIFTTILFIILFGVVVYLFVVYLFAIENILHEVYGQIDAINIELLKQKEFIEEKKNEEKKNEEKKNKQKAKKMLDDIFSL